MKLSTILTVIISLSFIFLMSPKAGGQEDTTLVEQKIITRKKAFIMSSLFPGLGQMASGHNLKGMVLAASEVVSLAIGVNSNEEYKSRLTNFNEIRDEYENLRNGGTYEEAENKWRELKSTNDKLDRLHRNRLIFGYIAAGIYAYNLVDILLVHHNQPETQKTDVEKNRLEIYATTFDGSPAIAVTTYFYFK